MSEALAGFTTVYSPGPGWVSDRGLPGQEGFRDQVLWWKRHEREGRLRLLGSPVDRPEILVVEWRCASLEEASALVSASPLVRSGIFAAQTRPGTSKG